MTDSTIYKSREGEKRIKQLYDELVASFDAPFERRHLDTGFGDTHVLVTGSKGAPPLVVFHGGNMVNPVSLEWFLPLASSFRIYAPDTVGHPGYSAETRLSARDGSYGRWVVDLLDELELEQVPMVGPSYGGGIILQTAVHAPERIRRAGLVVPSGLGNGPYRRMMTEIVLPLVVYKLTGRRSWLERTVAPIFSEDVTEIDDRVLELVALSFDAVKLETEFPKTVTREELDDFDAPTYLAAADDDVFFPADVVIPHAKRTIPNLERVVRLGGESHIPGPSARDEITDALQTFLTQ